MQKLTITCEDCQVILTQNVLSGTEGRIKIGTVQFGPHGNLIEFGRHKNHTLILEAEFTEQRDLAK